MKKNIFWSFLIILMAAFASLTLVSCGDDEETTSIITPTPPDPISVSIVGTWKYTWDSGYMLLTLNADGTGTSREWDHGRWEEPGEAISYTYSDGKLHIIHERWDETLNVKSLTATEFVVTDYDGQPEVTFVKQQSGGKEETVSIVGTWKYTWDTGYYLLTLNADGTGEEREWDHGRWEDNDVFTYTYNNGELRLIYSDGDVEILYVKSLTSTEFVVLDYDGEEEVTFYKQQSGGEEETVSIVGIWKYTFDSGYILLTFKADGTGTYREWDHGRWEDNDSFSYTFSGEKLYLTDEEGDEEAYDVLSLSSTKLVIIDFADEGETTFYRQ